MLCGPREALVLELSARQGAVRRPHRGLLTATNHYQSPAMQATERPLSPPPPLFRALRRIISPRPTARPATSGSRSWPRTAAWVPCDLQKILADPGIANAGTAVCTVFHPADRLLWVARGQTPPVNRGPFVAIKLWD